MVQHIIRADILLIARINQCTLNHLYIAQPSWLGNFLKICSQVFSQGFSQAYFSHRFFHRVLNFEIFSKFRLCKIHRVFHRVFSCHRVFHRFFTAFSHVFIQQWQLINEPYWAIPENIHTIPWMAFRISEGEGRFMIMEF